MADLAISTATIDGFFRRWEASDAAERANYSMFLNELCDLLNVPRPDPAGPDDEKNTYVFESGRGHPLPGTQEPWAGPIASSSHLPPAPAGVRSYADLPPPVTAFHPLPNFFLPFFLLLSFSLFPLFLPSFSFLFLRLGRFEKYYASVLIPACMMGE